MANYIDNFNSLDWQMPFARTGKFPIDKSSIFGSLADAKKYAKGDSSDLDERELALTSYVGQIITVYENSKVEVYKITEDRTLEKVGNGLGTITAENYDAALLLAKADNIGQVIYCLNDQKTENREYAKGPYIVTAEGTLLKLASSTASGDVTKDVQDLQTKVGDLEGVVGKTKEDGLQKSVADNTANIVTNTSDIATIKGEGEGSFKKAVSDLETKLVGGAPEGMNTFEEVNAELDSIKDTLGNKIEQVDGVKAISVTKEPLPKVSLKLAKGGEKGEEEGKAGNVTLSQTDAGLKAEVKVEAGSSEGAIKIGTSEAVVNGWNAVAKTETVNANIDAAKKAVLGGTTEEVTDTVKSVKEAITAEASRADNAEKLISSAIEEVGKTAGTALQTVSVEGAIEGDGKAGTPIKVKASGITNDMLAGSIADAKISGVSASKVTLADAAGKTEKTNVEDAIAELYTKEGTIATALGSKGVQNETTAFGLIDKNAKAIETLNSAVVGGTHYIGIYSAEGPMPTDKIFTDKYPKEEGHVPAEGDFVVWGQKEYIFSNKAWVELGDTSKEAERIKAVENKTADVTTTVGDLIDTKVVELGLENIYAGKGYETKVDVLETKLEGVDKVTTSVETAKQAAIGHADNLNSSMNTRVEAVEGKFDTETGKANNALEADNATKAYGKSEEELKNAILAGKSATAGTADTANAVAKPERDNIIDEATQKAATAGDTAYAKKEVEGYFGEGIGKDNTVSAAIATAKSGAETTANEYTDSKITEEVSRADAAYVAKDNYIAYSQKEKEKLEGIAEGAQVNVLETITVNDASEAVSTSGKNVNIKQETAHVKLSAIPKFAGVESGVTMDAVLTDIYAKLNEVNGAKVSSVLAKDGDQTIEVTGDGKDVKLSVGLSGDENNLLKMGTDKKLFAAMYYDEEVPVNPQA